MEEIVYIQSLISIGILVVGLFWLYRDYKVDSFRQKMFELRDELFDDAMKNGVAFDNDAYQVLRNTVNGFIQFAHRLNIFQFFSFVALAESRASKERRVSYTRRFDAGLEKLSDEQKDLMKQYRLRMNILMLTHMLSASPLSALLIFTPIGYIVKTKEKTTKYVRRYRKEVGMFDAVALARGESVIRS